MRADAPVAQRVSFDEARTLVRANSPPVIAIEAALGDARGLVTAADICAVTDFPSFDTSAMDGFAFDSALSAAASSLAPVRLPIGAAARAGRSFPRGVPGTAYPISTGAPLPPGCDVVLTREMATAADAVLMLDAPQDPGRHIRRQGEDARVGEHILGPGRVLTPEMIGALSCYGVSRLSVAKPPVVAVLSTGEELMTPPIGKMAHTIFDANGPMIAAMVGAMGLRSICTPPLPDNPAHIAEALGRLMSEAAADIVISTGGVSGGDHDHVPAVLRAIGATVHFHGVSMRPGKPVLFATLPDGTVFFGLPGNPVAAATGFRFFATMAIRAMLGLPIETGRRVALPMPARPGTTLVLKARSTIDAGGAELIEILQDQRSHTLRPLIDANCWIVVSWGLAGDALNRRFDLSGSFLA